MNCINEMKRIKEVEELFFDEKSKQIFRARVLYNSTGDIRYIHRMLKETDFPFDKVLDEFHHMEDTYGIFEEMDLLSWLLDKKVIQEQKIILLGCGTEGGNFISLLEQAGYKNISIVDNSIEKQGTMYFGRRIQNIEGVKYDDQSIFVISAPSAKEILGNQLRVLGIAKEQMYLPPHNALMSFVGTPYFESGILKPEKNEIFVDAGCYNGSTSLEFIEWNKNYKKIVAFEPGEENFKMCQDAFKKQDDLRVELRNTGLWSENTELHFQNSGDNGTGGHLEDAGEEVVKVESLDSVLNGEKITFLKMDIEGAEMNALKGASDTIRTYKPKLAICVYLLDVDILDIPSYIHELVPEYKMVLRHYNTFYYDTVLYAWV
jgi:FkbM family methyltransferase